MASKSKKRYSLKKTVTMQWNAFPERLPPCGGKFLVTSVDRYGYFKIEMLTYEYFVGSLWHGMKERRNIVAWMELPEPFNPEQP